MATTVDSSRVARRIALVEEHVRAENAHELDRLMETMGAALTYDLNQDRIDGRDGIRDFYAGLPRAFPDFNVEVKHRHVGDEAITLEVVITGTQREPWNGVPSAGGRIEVPVCAIFPFDADDRLAGERIYFDLGLMLRQMGAPA